MNIVDAILYQCRVNPTSTAIVVPGGRIHLLTYAGIERILNSLTREMLRLGFEAGDVVGVGVDDKVFHIVLTLALTRLGVITVFCGDRPLPPQLGAKAVVADRAVPAENAGRIVRVDPKWLQGDGQAPTDSRVDKAGGDDVCRLFPVSGSSGPARFVALTHNAMLARNGDLDFAHGARFPRCARLHCDMDLSAPAAFRYVSYMLMRGGTILLRGGSAADADTSTTVYRIEHMVTALADFERLVKFYKPEQPYRCDLDHVVVLGGPLPRDLAAQGREHLSRNIISCYGSIETGPAAAADSRAIADMPGAAGYILPGVTVEIVDEKDARLPAGAEGLVRVQSGSMAEGYFRDPAPTQAAFRDGFFYSGDRGRLSADGLLVISGRA